MKVTVDINAGFCWGVIRTIDIIESVLDSSPEGTSVYCLGDVIHNPIETKRLEKKGLKTINHDDLKNLRGSKVVIRAHGEPPETYRLAEKYGIELIDATCPVVWKIQERIKNFYEKGFQIVIYGKKDHAEVKGLIGQTNGDAVVIGSLEEVDKVDLKKKTVLFSQTTMDKKTFNKIKEYFQARIKELIIDSFEEEAIEFHAKDTICGQVFGREKKIQEFASQYDVIIFVAGRNSSNGRVLYNLCQQVNPNTYFVENETEIQKDWLQGAQEIGITGATSTPQWLMNRIKEYIEKSFKSS